MKNLLKKTVLILGTGLVLSGIDYLSSYTQAIEINKSYGFNDSANAVVNNHVPKHKNIEKELNEFSDEE